MDIVWRIARSSLACYRAVGGLRLCRGTDGKEFLMDYPKNLFDETLYNFIYGCGIAHHRSVGLLGDGIVSVLRAESILVHSECAVSCLCIRLQMAE